MYFRDLTNHDLAAFCANIIVLLTGPELGSLDSQTRARLLAAFGTLPGELRARTETAELIENLRREAISDRNDVRRRLHTVVRQVRDALSSRAAPNGEFAIAGLSYVKKPRGRYLAVDPSDLVVTGTSNGVNRLKFLGNNRRVSVRYEIWRRERGPWAILTSITRQVYHDTPVKPGQYYEYRVRALAAGSVSDFSNTAVVYGSI
jgi:hypothetical protein